MTSTKKDSKTEFQNSGESEEMANKELAIIQTPAFGRPFRLGMLYDRVSDNIIPGETLLTMKDMENHIYKVKRGGCSSEIIFEDSLEHKSTAYKGDANLELNMLKGAAALGASGKFLKNDKSTKNELKMSLTADYIMMYQELEMKQCESLISNTKTNATHIVTAIEYGKKVTFTFNRSISKDEDALEISGELKGMLDKIPSLNIEGNIAGGMEQIDKKKNEKISCKYCGDVILPENPTTYEEAVVCYRQLPKYFEENGEVPLTVWLYPIPKPSTPANTIVQTINKEKMKQAVIALEDLQRIHAQCNDLMSGHAYALIPEVQRKIENFRRIVQAFQEEFQEQALGELLKEDKRTRRSMSQWREMIAAFTKWIFQNAEREIDLLNVYINEIKAKNIEILPVSSVDGKLFEQDYVMILDIVLPFSDGQYPNPNAIELDQVLPEIPENGWYTNDDIKPGVRSNIKKFVNTISEEFKKFKLFVTLTDVRDSNPVGARVVVYQNGVRLGDLNILVTDVAESLGKLLKIEKIKA